MWQLELCIDSCLSHSLLTFYLLPSHPSLAQLQPVRHLPVSLPPIPTCYGKRRRDKLQWRRASKKRGAMRQQVPFQTLMTCLSLSFQKIEGERTFRLEFCFLPFCLLVSLRPILCPLSLSSCPFNFAPLFSSFSQTSREARHNKITTTDWFLPQFDPSAQFFLLSFRFFLSSRLLLFLDRLCLCVVVTGKEGRGARRET